MSIDTVTEKSQLRTSFGLGSTDTVEFGGLIPPSGTTAEIDLITTATIGQVIIDTDRSVSVRFTGASTYEDIARSIPTADIALNTAKVTNATHTGDVTGDTALTISTGAVDVPMLSATGTADATTYLRGDNSWASVISSYPYTTDFQSGVEQTRNLTTIDSSSGFSYTGQPSSIYIGSNVTSIGSYAFPFSPLTSIIIPSSVTSIGGGAFTGCTSLTSATIGNSVTSIPDGAFINCTSLTSATIGNSVTSIGNNAFYQCTGLTSVIIPDSVTSIGNSAFNSCTSLTSINIPDSVTSIGFQAFYQCTSLTSATIGNSVTSIGNYAFYGNAFSSIIIPDSVISIGGSAFFACTNLATINCLATTAPTIGSSAFQSVAATDIHVPVGATYPATYGGLTVIFDL